MPPQALSYPTNLLWTEAVKDGKQDEYNLMISYIEERVGKLHSLKNDLPTQPLKTISGKLGGNRGFLAQINECIDDMPGLVSTDRGGEGQIFESTCARVKLQLELEATLLRLAHPTEYYTNSDHSKGFNAARRYELRNRFKETLAKVRGQLKELGDKHRQVMYDACVQSISQDKDKVEECARLVTEALKDDKITKARPRDFAITLFEENEAFGPESTGAALEIRKAFAPEVENYSIRDAESKVFRGLGVLESLVANRKWIVGCNKWLTDILERKKRPALTFIFNAQTAGANQSASSSGLKKKSKNKKRKAEDTLESQSKKAARASTSG